MKKRRFVVYGIKAPFLFQEPMIKGGYKGKRRHIKKAVQGMLTRKEQKGSKFFWIT